VGYNRHGGAGQGHHAGPGGSPGPWATTPPQALVAPEVRAALGEADLVVLNLECYISERGRPWDAPGKPFFFRAPPRAVELLALLGTDCVPLANNHALDYGVAAAGRLVLADPRRRSPTETRGCLAGRTSRRVELPIVS
jgi:Bacterial capsule synthesis protein PGA_cap